jgi:hypothetical protein
VATLERIDTKRKNKTTRLKKTEAVAKSVGNTNKQIRRTDQKLDRVLQNHSDETMALGIGLGETPEHEPDLESPQTPSFVDHKEASAEVLVS